MCLASLKTLESSKHKVRRVKGEDRLAVIEIFGRLGFKFTIFDSHAPFAAPFTGNLNTVYHIHTCSGFGIHRGRQEGVQHIRDQYSGGSLIKFAVLFAQAPAYIPGVDTVIHHMEGRVEKGWQRTHERMCDEETAPLLRGQFLKGIHHRAVICFEARNGLFTRQAAERLRMLIEVMTHDQQSDGVTRFVVAGAFPTSEVTFGHIEHMTDHVTHLPFRTTGLNVPVMRIVHEIEEISAFLADDIEDSIFAAVIHRVNRGHNLLLPIGHYRVLPLSVEREHNYFLTSDLLYQAALNNTSIWAGS